MLHTRRSGRLALGVAWGMVLAIAACTNAASTGPKKTTPPKLTSQQAVGPVVGAIVAPAGIVAAGGGNIVAAGGGNLVGKGGAGIVAAGGGNFRLNAVGGKGLAGVTVALVDAARQPLPGVSAVVTDANGRYTLVGVPAGTYLLLARTQTKEGQAAPLLTIVKVGAAGATADADMASTFVAVAVAEGRAGGLDGLDPASAGFRRAFDATARSLTEADVAALTDRSLMLSRMEALAGEVAEIKDGLAAVGRQISDLQAQLAALARQLGSPAPGTGASAPPFVVPRTITVLAGGPEAGFVDGTAAEARFDEPWSPCVTADGRVYLADTPNHAIRAIAPDGTVSTVAGARPAKAGYVDDGVGKALLNVPTGIAIELGGHRSFFIADSENHVLRGLDLDAAGGPRLVTAAGTGMAGSDDEGDPGPATLRRPFAVSVARDGTLFCTDPTASALRYMRLGSLRTAILTPAAGLSADDIKLVNPLGVAAGAGTRLFVSDATRNVVLRLTLRDTMRYTVDLVGGAEAFTHPAGLAIAPSGLLLVTEMGGHRLSVVDPDSGRILHQIGGAAPLEGATYLPADFGEVTGVAAGAGGVLYVTDKSNHRVWKMAP